MQAMHGTVTLPPAAETPAQRSMGTRLHYTHLCSAAMCCMLVEVRLLLWVLQTAEARVDQLISRIRPARHSEARRHSVAGYVSSIISSCFSEDGLEVSCPPHSHCLNRLYAAQP